MGAVPFGLDGGEDPPGQAPVSPRLMAPKIPNILVLTTPSTAMTRAGTAVMDTETRHRLELFDPKTRPDAIKLLSAVTKIPEKAYEGWVFTTRDYYSRPDGVV